MSLNAFVSQEGWLGVGGKGDSICNDCASDTGGTPTPNRQPNAELPLALPSGSGQIWTLLSSSSAPILQQPPSQLTWTSAATLATIPYAPTFCPSCSSQRGPEQLSQIPVFCSEPSMAPISLWVKGQVLPCSQRPYSTRFSTSLPSLPPNPPISLTQLWPCLPVPHMFCPRTFAPAVSSAWNALLPGNHMDPSLPSSFSSLIKDPRGTSLEVQWLRIHLTLQRIWVQSLVRELRSHTPQGN